VFKNIKRRIIVMALAGGCAQAAWAQQPADPAPAPMPVQIAAAKKVFISNASRESNVPPGVSELTYNEFYAAMKSWGAYELMSAPAEADLILEIRFNYVLGPTNVMNGVGSSSLYQQFRLVVLDPKTHVVLWALTQSIQGAFRQTTGRKNFDLAMAALVENVKKLALQTVASGEAVKN
jgi:hypothetical protein